MTEEKSVFMGLSTRDNLRVARVDVDEALALFPELSKRLGVRGTWNGNPRIVNQTRGACR